jgi:hypothetical protein
MGTPPGRPQRQCDKRTGGSHGLDRYTDVCAVGSQRQPDRDHPLHCRLLWQRACPLWFYIYVRPPVVRGRKRLRRCRKRFLCQLPAAALVLYIYMSSSSTNSAHTST